MNNTIEVLQEIIKDETRFRGYEGIGKKQINALTKAIATLKAVEEAKKIHLNCTTSKMAEQLDIPLWKVIEMGKYMQEKYKDAVDAYHAVESAEGLPEKWKHSSDCIKHTNSHPKYKRNPDRYCICGATDFNQAIDQCQIVLAKQILKVKELEAEIKELDLERYDLQDTRDKTEQIIGQQEIRITELKAKIKEIENG